MYISTTSNIFATIQNKTIASKKSQAQSIPYFFTTVNKEKKQNTTKKNANKFTSKVTKTNNK